VLLYSASHFISTRKFGFHLSKFSNLLYPTTSVSAVYPDKANTFNFLKNCKENENVWDEQLSIHRSALFACVTQVFELDSDLKTFESLWRLYFEYYPHREFQKDTDLI